MSNKKTIFVTYEKFLASVPEHLRDEAVEMYIRSSFRRIFMSSIIFFFIAVLSIFRDILVGYYAISKLNYLNLISLCFLALGSVVIVIAAKLDKVKTLSLNACRALHWFYYCVLGISLAPQFFREFYNGVFICYEQFYWLFFSAVPLLRFRSNLINAFICTTVFLTEFIIIACMKTVVIADFVYFIPVLLVFCIFGLYLRDYYLKSIVFTLKNRELAEQLRSRSRIDPLTKCLNRYVMHECFENLRESCGYLAVFMFDIDDFKNYNDGFTHLKGDECLVAVSKCAREVCKENGAELFRYGGEEFFIIAPRMNEIEAQKLGTSIVRGVNALQIPMPSQYAAKQPYVTVSLGAAVVDVNRTSNMKDAIAAADLQLYAAKGGGKNCVSFNNRLIF